MRTHRLPDLNAGFAFAGEWAKAMSIGAPKRRSRLPRRFAMIRTAAVPRQIPAFVTCWIVSKVPDRNAPFGQRTVTRFLPAPTDAWPASGPTCRTTRLTTGLAVIAAGAATQLKSL